MKNDSKLVRVKKLDTEDIQAEGWIYKITEYHGHELYKSTFNNSYQLLYNPDTLHCIILINEIVSFPLSATPQDSYSAFVGTIRNRSELNRIMKQVGII